MIDERLGEQRGKDFFLELLGRHTLDLLPDAVRSTVLAVRESTHHALMESGFLTGAEIVRPDTDYDAAALDVIARRGLPSEVSLTDGQRAWPRDVCASGGGDGGGLVSLNTLMIDRVFAPLIEKAAAPAASGTACGPEILETVYQNLIATLGRTGIATTHALAVARQHAAFSPPAILTAHPDLCPGQRARAVHDAP